MKARLLALAGIVVVLSACSGGLEAEPAQLETQKVTGCNIDSEILRNTRDNSRFAVGSAECFVVRDGVDELQASSRVQKYVSGTWKNVSAARSTVRKSLRPDEQAGYINFPDVRSPFVPCEAGRYRPLVVVRSYVNGTATQGPSFRYLGPEHEVVAGDCGL